MKGRTTIVMFALAAVLAGCRSNDAAPQQRTFQSPKAAVEELVAAVDKGDLPGLHAIFGPDAQALVDSSDPATGRRNQQVFRVAAAERWRLEAESAERLILIVGFEDWPFPIPLVQEGGAWRFDTAAGKEEILARRIGRNELAVIRICHTYAAAQRLYAKYGHDGKPSGIYARAFGSSEARQDGLYWAARPGERRSPLGDLMAGAAVEAEKRGDGEPRPFHGYHFRILTAQGPAAAGGAADYLVNGELSRGFALVAWPAFYDVSGVMTFVLNHDGTVFEKDLGPGTNTDARAMTLYNPDESWSAVPLSAASGRIERDEKPGDVGPKDMSMLSHTRTLNVMTVIVLTVWIGGGLYAAKIKVRAEQDPDFDFAAVRTWGWDNGAGRVIMARTASDDPAALKARVDPLIRQYVQVEMAKKGLQEATGAADVQLDYYVLVTLNVTGQSMGQFLPSVPYWGLPPFPPATTSLNAVTKGSMVLDAMAPGRVGQRKVVWRGVAQSTVSDVDPPATRESRLQSATAELIKRFPVKKKKK